MVSNIIKINVLYVQQILNHLKKGLIFGLLLQMSTNFVCMFSHNFNSFLGFKFPIGYRTDFVSSEATSNITFLN